MDVHAVNDDPLELAKLYCEKHNLDFAEHGTHVEVEIQKDMLQACRVKIENLLKQREAMKDRVVSMSHSALSLKLKQAVEMLKMEEVSRGEVNSALEESREKINDLDKALSTKTEEAKKLKESARIELENLREVHREELEHRARQAQDKVKHLCSQHDELLQDVERENQQLLESATSAAMEKASQSERELEVQRASVKVLTLSHDEKIIKLEKGYALELKEHQTKVKNLQKIVSGNNETIRKRNAKIKTMKDEMARRQKENAMKTDSLEKDILEGAKTLKNAREDHHTAVEKMKEDYSKQLLHLEQMHVTKSKSIEAARNTLEGKLSESLAAITRIQSKSCSQRSKILRKQCLATHFASWMQRNMREKYRTLSETKQKEGNALKEELTNTTRKIATLTSMLSKKNTEELKEAVTEYHKSLKVLQDTNVAMSTELSQLRKKENEISAAMDALVKESKEREIRMNHQMSIKTNNIERIREIYAGRLNKHLREKSFAKYFAAWDSHCKTKAYQSLQSQRLSDLEALRCQKDKDAQVLRNQLEEGMELLKRTHVSAITEKENDHSREQKTTMDSLKIKSDLLAKVVDELDTERRKRKLSHETHRRQIKGFEKEIIKLKSKVQSLQNETVSAHRQIKETKEESEKVWSIASKEHATMKRDMLSSLRQAKAYAQTVEVKLREEETKTRLSLNSAACILMKSKKIRFLMAHMNVWRQKSAISRALRRNQEDFKVRQEVFMRRHKQETAKLVEEGTKFKKVLEKTEINLAEKQEYWRTKSALDQKILNEKDVTIETLNERVIEVEASAEESKRASFLTCEALKLQYQQEVSACNMLRNRIDNFHEMSSSALFQFKLTSLKMRHFDRWKMTTMAKIIEKRESNQANNKLEKQAKQASKVLENAVKTVSEKYTKLENSSKKEIARLEQDLCNTKQTFERELKTAEVAFNEQLTRKEKYFEAEAIQLRSQVVQITAMLSKDTDDHKAAVEKLHCEQAAAAKIWETQKNQLQAKHDYEIKVVKETVKEETAKLATDAVKEKEQELRNQITLHAQSLKQLSAEFENRIKNVNDAHKSELEALNVDNIITEHKLQLKAKEMEYIASINHSKSSIQDAKDKVATLEQEISALKMKYSFVMERTQKQHDLSILEASSTMQVKLDNLERTLNSERDGHKQKLRVLQERFSEDRIAHQKELMEKEKQKDKILSDTMDTHRNVLRTLRQTIEKTASENRLKLEEHKRAEMIALESVAALKKRIEAMSVSMEDITIDKVNAERTFHLQLGQASVEMERLREENKNLVDTQKNDKRVEEMDQRLTLAQNKLAATQKESKEIVEKKVAEAISSVSKTYENKIATLQKKHAAINTSVHQEHIAEIESLNFKMKTHLKNIDDRHSSAMAEKAKANKKALMVMALKRILRNKVDREKARRRQNGFQTWRDVSVSPTSVDICCSLKNSESAFKKGKNRIDIVQTSANQTKTRQKTISAVIREYEVAMTIYVKYRQAVEVTKENPSTKRKSPSVEGTAKFLHQAKLKFLKVQDMCDKGLSSFATDSSLLLYKARALSCVSVVQDAMGEIHEAVFHGDQAALLFRQLEQGEKEFQTLANTYIAKIRVYTEDVSRKVHHLHVAYKYVQRMVKIASTLPTQKNEVARLTRRLQNLQAAIDGKKDIEWVSGKGLVRKVIFRETEKPKLFCAEDAKENRSARKMKPTPRKTVGHMQTSFSN